ncbi:MAG: NAD(P)-binding protein, partial [Planctomycetota bacterium]
MEPRIAVTVPDAEYFRDLVPCMAACPVHTDAGAYVRAIAEGRDREAYDTAAAPNPLVSVCGRVCAHPCEEACRRGKLDQPIAIRALKRYVCERYGVESIHAEPPQPAPDRRAARIAVVGGGPAGISCAHYLVRWGYRVTLFDVAPR